MNPRVLLRTTAAILVLGLASVAGSQPNQQTPDAGSSKQQDKPDQAKGKGQRPAQAQGRQQGHAQAQPQARAQGQAQGRQQGQAQGRQQGRAQGQPQAQAQGRQQGRAQGRPQTAAPTVQRRAAVQAPAQRTATQGVRSQRGGSRQTADAPMRNRQAPAPRQVASIAPAPRIASSHAEQQGVWPRYRAQAWNTQHRTWAQRGGYGGYRIPSASFGIYFGRPHRFHLSSYQIRVVGEYPEFYADGFWFTVMDPVPEYWGDDWYDSDYVTIVQQDDGYYLLDETHPDALVAISVQIG
jgi:hypothetical protein